MKQEQRTIYSRRFIRSLDSWTSDYIEPVAKALKTQITEFIRAYKNEGERKASVVLGTTFLNAKLAKIIRDIHLDAGVSFANKKYGEIIKSARQVQKAANFGLNDVWTERVLQYLQKYLLTKSVLPVTENNKQFILDIIERAKQEGWGIDKIAAELEDFEQLMWRARRVVVTELIHADNNALQMAAEESPFEVNKEWIAAHDLRTRQGHREMDGVVVMATQLFQVNKYRGKLLVGAENMTGPGDPEASAGNVINCRCTVALSAATDEKGNVIEKPHKKAV